MTVTISFIFQGSRLYREPIDVNLEDSEWEMANASLGYNPVLSIKKGFTHLFLVYSFFVVCHLA